MENLSTILRNIVLSAVCNKLLEFSCKASTLSRLRKISAMVGRFFGSLSKHLCAIQANCFKHFEDISPFISESTISFKRPSFIDSWAHAAIPNSKLVSAAFFRHNTSNNNTPKEYTSDLGVSLPVVR
ncbi:hypothetical protein Hanom_Chr09g00767451 [Helianthus anomalus]